MTPYELKAKVEEAREESKFFSRENMKFAGDTMSNYGVRDAIVISNYDEEGNWKEGGGVEVEVWELYRRRPVKMGLQSSAFFSKRTFQQVRGVLKS